MSYYTPRLSLEIGDKLLLTRERIRQIEQKAMRKLSRSNKLQQLRGYLN
ncbi:MAG: sigma factor-like helix-turn-helix DNA-binding protein [Candidatus Aminicenantales bacterium]